MKKKWFLLCFVILFLSVLSSNEFVINSHTETSSTRDVLLGAGTENNPYLISTLNDLLILSTNSTYWYSIYFFEQTNDIDASDTQDWNDGEGFYPIGSNSESGPYFAGIYNGNGYTISNLYINRPNMNYVGFIGKVAIGAIANLGLVNASITGGSCVGGLVGSFRGYGSYYSIKNCFVSGSITGISNVGGLAGSAANSISNNTELINSFSSANVNGDSITGGLIGTSDINLHNCYYSGTVSGQDTVGGLVCFLNSSKHISNCYSSGEITGIEKVGGLIGEISPIEVWIEETWDQNYEGCICQELVKNSYATGYINSQGFAGAILGYVEIYTQNEPEEGFNSVDIYFQEFITSSFWDRETTNVYNMVGEVSSPDYWPDFNDSGSSGLETYEMQTEQTYIDAGWDFLGESDNGTDELWRFYPEDYPKLTWVVDENDILNPPTNFKADKGGFLTWNRIFQRSQTNRAFVGYNIYRNNIKINNNVILNNMYSDTTAPTEGVYDYYVTALYGSGESEPSNHEQCEVILHSLIGSGTEEAPYLITDLRDLLYLSVTPDLWEENTYFEQTANIDASETRDWNFGRGFLTIATTGYYPFSGIYNGNSFTINGLFINRPDIASSGLFGALFGEVKNLGIINAHIYNGYWYGGAISGYASGAIISKCYSTGIVLQPYSTTPGSGLIGGLWDNTIVVNCYTTAGSELIKWCNSSIVVNCYSAGLNNERLIGLSYGESTITNSFYTINPSAQTFSEFGTGLTTSDLKPLSTYCEAGWDFVDETENGVEDIWTFVANDYPHLTNEGLEQVLVTPPTNLRASVANGSISLTWAYPGVGRSLIGYNIFRDNIQINEEIISLTTFNDENIEHGETYNYYATAVYDEGESEPSNEVIMMGINSSVILPNPANVLISLDGESATLNWNQVNMDIENNQISNVLYIVYYNNTNPHIANEYFYLDNTTDVNYVVDIVENTENYMFYGIKAYIDVNRATLDLINQQFTYKSRLNLVDLEELIKK